MEEGEEGDEYEIEMRPIRRRDAVEAGLDYWIDEGDLERERQRKIAVRNRKVRILSKEFQCEVFISFSNFNSISCLTRFYDVDKYKAMEGEISRDKLREEVVAPYKQNWIGIFSVIIIILSTIATKFPEVMQIPVIQIPDL